MKKIKVKDKDLDISNGEIAYGSSALTYVIDEDSAVVHSMNASPPRCGIGTRLYAKLEKIAKADGCKMIYVPCSLTAEAVCFWRARIRTIERFLKPSEFHVFPDKTLLSGLSPFLNK